MATKDGRSAQRVLGRVRLGESAALLHREPPRRAGPVPGRSALAVPAPGPRPARATPEAEGWRQAMTTQFYPHSLAALGLALFFSAIGPRAQAADALRSEERRVGEE